MKNHILPILLVLLMAPFQLAYCLPAAEEAYDTEINLQCFTDSLGRILKTAKSSIDKDAYIAVSDSIFNQIAPIPYNGIVMTKEAFARYCAFVLYGRGNESVAEHVSSALFMYVLAHRDTLSEIQSWLKELIPEQQKEIISQMFTDVAFNLSCIYNNRDFVYAVIADNWPELLKMCKGKGVDQQRKLNQIFE